MMYALSYLDVENRYFYLAYRFIIMYFGIEELDNDDCWILIQDFIWVHQEIGKYFAEWIYMGMRVLIEIWWYI